MTLRITASKTRAATTDLTILHQSDTLLIEGDSSVSSIQLSCGRTAYLAGSPIGIRQDATVVKPGDEVLKELLSSSTLADASQAIEGFCIVAVVNVDGSVEVGADRYGRGNVYMMTSGDATILTSDMSLLPGWPDFEAHDQVALAHIYTVYGYRAPRRQTQFQAVSRLGIGDTWSSATGFTEASFTPKAPKTYDDSKLDEYADLFLDAIDLCASDDGNIVYLSSGWDSTSILAGLVHVKGKKNVRAVIGRMNYAHRSGLINKFEIDRAKGVADYYDIPLEICEFDYRDDVSRVRELYRAHAPQHAITSSTMLNHFLLADHVAKDYQGEMVFAGEISDGSHNLGFSQYATIFHPMLEFREYSDKMIGYLYGPTFLQQLWDGKHDDDVIYNLFRQRSGDAHFDGPGADKVARTRQVLSSFFLRGNRLPLYSLDNVSLLTAEGRKAYTDSVEAGYLNEAAEQITPETLYAWYLHLYNAFHWQGGTVACIDLATQAMGLKLALPFWDSRLIDFLSYMPETWGRSLDLNPTKYPLKWMLKNRIDYPLHLQTGPHSYLYDVDHSFNHSAELLYGSAFKPYWQESMTTGFWRNQLSTDVFDIGLLDRIAADYVAGIEIDGADRNTLFTLCMMGMLEDK